MKLFFRLFFKSLRLILGPILLLLEWLTPPKGIVRAEAEQKLVDQATSKLALYQFRTCPFCIKVRRTVKRLSLDIEKYDAQHDPQNRQELLNGGGKIKVPCLRIVNEQGETSWIYESSVIIKYLQQSFA